MATPIVSTIKTLDVTLNDAGGYDTTFKLNNPQDNLSLEQVKNVFDSAINAEWYYSNKNLQFTTFKSAKLVETVKTVTTLE